MLSRIRISVLGFLLGSLLSGCFHFSSLHTARPVEKDKVQLNASPTVVRFPFSVVDDDDPDGIWIPTPEFQFRYGLSDRWDFGATYTFPLGLTLDGNYMYYDSEMISLSVNPTVQPFFAADTGGGIFFAMMSSPFLVDIRMGKIVSLTLNAGPGLAVGGAAAGGDTDFSAFGRGTFARGGGFVKFQVTEGFSISPGVSSMYFFDFSDDADTRLLLLNGSLNFGFDL